MTSPTLILRRRSAHRPGRSLLTLIAAATTSAIVVLSAQTLLQDVRKGATIAGITEYTYPNGLRALLLPDSGSSTITVNVTYLVGSRHEGYGETGMAHLLEHMNFIKSTHDRDIKKELEDHGARWNGTTDYDRTNYFETVNASDENLRWALDLEAERMVNMRIEKGTARHGNDRRAQRVRAWREQRPEHPRGARALDRLPVAQLRQVDDRLARRHRARADRPPRRLLSQVLPARQRGRDDRRPDRSGADARLRGQHPWRDSPSRADVGEPYTVEPPQDGERSVELRRVGRGKNLILAYHAPAMAHPDSAALEVTAGILAGRGGTGRLDKALVDGKKALSVGMSLEELHDPGFVMVRATLNDDQSLEDAKKIALETIADLAHDAPGQEEVDRAKTRIVQGMDRTMANSQQLAMQLNEIIASGDWRLLFTNYEELKRVTAGRRPACGGALLQGFESHRRYVHSRGRARTHDGAGGAQH